MAAPGAAARGREQQRSARRGERLRAVNHLKINEDASQDIYKLTY